MCINMKFSVSLFLLVTIQLTGAFTIDQAIASASQTGNDVTGNNDVTEGGSPHDLDMMLTEEQRQALFATDDEDEVSAPPPPPANQPGATAVKPRDSNPPQEIEQPVNPPQPLSQVDTSDLQTGSNDHVIAAAMTPEEEVIADNDDVEGELHETDKVLTDVQRQLLLGYLEHQAAINPPPSPPPTTTTTTTTTEAPTTAAVKKNSNECSDANNHCFWVRKDKDFCQTNTYVKMYCRKSCGLCHIAVEELHLCIDHIEVCGHLKARGYCQGIFHDFMGTTCRKTCGFC